MESNPPNDAPPTAEFFVPVAMRAQAAPTGRKVPVLFVLNGLDAGRLFVLDGPASVIGREKGVEVQLSDSAMSRKHARVLRAGDAFIIEDLESRNGTFVNNERVTSRPLTAGDHISVSPNVVLRFSHIDEAEANLGKKLFEASTRDPLTQVYNRKYLMERVVAESSFGLRHAGQFGVLMFDIDYFKKVNDTHGHAAGDAVLHAVAQRVVRLVRAEDIVARYGGEEFVVAVRGVPASGMRKLADRVRSSIAELSVEATANDGAKVTVRVTVSIGVAMLEDCPPKTTTGSAAEHLLAIADRRLYVAKNGGRNRIVVDGS